MTAHAAGPTIVGEAAAERLMRTLTLRAGPGELTPSREQVAVVLRALANHTMLTYALRYQPPHATHWPPATTLGAWLQDTADQLTAP